MILTFSAVAILFIGALLTLTVGVAVFGLAAATGWWLTGYLGRQSPRQPFRHFRVYLQQLPERSLLLPCLHGVALHERVGLIA